MIVAQISQPDPTIPVWLNVMFLALTFAVAAYAAISNRRNASTSNRTSEFDAMRQAFRDFSEQVRADNAETHRRLDLCEEECEECRQECDRKLAAAAKEHNREITVLQRKINRMEGR